VVVCLDIGAQLLNYRVAIRSYRETWPLLGDDTPTIASAMAMGRWMARWLRRSNNGARRHLSHRLRTLAHALLVLYTYLLYNLLTHGISGIARGALGQLVARSATILLPLPRLTSDILRAAHSILWLHGQNAAHRSSTALTTALTRLQSISAWLWFACKLALTLLALAWQHWTGPRALPIVPLPRAARSRPEANAVAVAAAASAATAATASPPPPADSPPPSSPSGPAAAATPTPPRGKVGYALKLARGKTRAKAKEAHALPASSAPSLPGFWTTRYPVTRWLRVVIDSGCT
jgi:hypothetical protein